MIHQSTGTLPIVPLVRLHCKAKESAEYTACLIPCPRPCSSSWLQAHLSKESSVLRQKVHLSYHHFGSFISLSRTFILLSTELTHSPTSPLTPILITVSLTLVLPSVSFLLISPCFLSPPPSSPQGSRHIHVVGVVLCCELHVPSCERALPEDGASSTETVSSHNFSKASLSPLRKKKKKAPAKGSARFCLSSPLLSF